jgi:dTDP-4-amino-4,6-dideoxygalactose transaminase
MQNEQNSLALKGGQPIATDAWAKWPRHDSKTVASLLEVLQSERWAITGGYDGRICCEKRFAEKFARYHGQRYCIPVTSGTTALMVAMQAVGVHYGSEVIVPGLTWVACASSVASLGAIPIIVDADPRTLCMSPEAIEKAITKDTAAIMMVHMYCNLANIDRILEIARSHSLAVIEDCSQAHGAEWRGQKVGTFGDIAAFSFQQSKLLTSGEGGAVLTNSTEHYERAQAYRADGRIYKGHAVKYSEMELDEKGEVSGQNYCLSEFQAAILADRLDHLDAENEVRIKNARFLDQELQKGEYGSLIPEQAGTSKRTFYLFVIDLNRAAFADKNPEVIADALTAELKVFVEPIDIAVHKRPIYNPLLSPRTPPESTFRKRLDRTRFVLPVAEAARARYLTLPHQALLGSQADMEMIVRGFTKVSRLAKQL